MEQGIKKIVQQYIIIEQNLLQIGEASTTIHGIKGNKIMQQLSTKDYEKKRIDFGWMDHYKMKEERKNIRKPYYLVSSHVRPLIANLRGQFFLKEGTML
jgi:hypothetical protein